MYHPPILRRTEVGIGVYLFNLMFKVGFFLWPLISISSPPHGDNGMSRNFANGEIGQCNSITHLLPNRVFSFTLATITSAFDPDFHFLKLVPSCHGTARVLKISRVVKEKGVSGTIHG